MEFSRLAELADDITVSEENRIRMFNRCKRTYEERKKKRILTVSVLSVLKTQAK